MIGTPTAQRPLLVGLLIDVSGSMTSSIGNASGSSQNRLQSFQIALGELAGKSRQISGEASDERVQLFAYGFGFGNLLGAIFSRASSPPVRDLLEGARHGPTTIGLNELAANWPHYESHVQGLAIKMFGATPMLEGVNTVAERISRERRHLHPCGTVLFILSDGEPTDSSPSDVRDAVARFRNDDTVVVSCYVTDHDITDARYLYGKPRPEWPQGAALMFDVASKIPLGTPFYHYLRERNWNLEADARLFTQVNQSEVLAEFLQVIISPLAEAHGKTPTIFVSYSHKDTRWRDRLQVHLKPLVRDRAIDLWDDTRIHTGQDWCKEIDTALSNAQAAILLISADFLASDFIASNELSPLLEAAKTRGVQILPIIVGPCRFSESPISRFQAVNSPDKPLSKLKKQEAEELLVAVSRDVARVA